MKTQKLIWNLLSQVDSFSYTKRITVNCSVAVNHILLPELSPNFKSINYLASYTFQVLQAFSKSKNVCKLA
jgi:hypothetical protein